MEQRYQVIIVGGGPVGVALAIELGRRNVTCALVERRLTPQRIPKGQNLTNRTMEHFYFWGIADALRAARLLPPGYPIGGITAYGHLMSEYWYPSFGGNGRGESVRPYYFQANERLPQYLTEEVLRRRLRELPTVTALFGWAATAITQDEGGVHVSIAEEADRRQTQTLTAAYLVGCDGAHSTVREQAGIDRGGIDFGQRMVLAVFRSRALHEALQRFPACTTYRVLHPALQGYWQFFGRVDVGEGWFFHAPAPPAVQTPQDVHALLQQAAGVAFPCTFEHVGFWELRIAVAQRYRAGRVLVAGDAAHSHPPYGGFGLNTGFEDAVNLGWKLAAVLQGWGGERLLASYEAERRPIAVQTCAEVIAGGIEQDRAFLERYHPERDRAEFERAWQELAARAQRRAQSYEPHYEGSPVVVGPAGGSPGIQGAYTFAARAGHHLAPRRLSDGHNVYEVLGEGFTLLAFGVEETAVAPLRAAARALGVPLQVVMDRRDGEVQAYEARLVLVRPDQYVAWAGEAPPPDADALLRRVVGRD